MTKDRVTPMRPGREAAASRSKRDSLYHRVFESMTCGVMLIDDQGMVETVNSAAAQILGLDRDALVGRQFAEALIANQNLDELNDIVLAAMYDREVGHERVANVIVQGRPVPLSVATSYLHDGTDGQHASQGLVAVFSDISEIERLRAREHELGKDIEAKHKEIRDANINLEKRNRELATVLRKVQVVRIAASVGVIVLVAGIGAWLWSKPPTDWLVTAPAPAGEPDATLRFITVEPTRIASTITIPSGIKPRREVPVISPSEGQIGAVHVQPGESVTAGQALLDLDLTEVQIRRRKALADHLKAQAQMKELETWADSVDASKARRAVVKARIALDAGDARLAETSFLVKQGLVPAARKDAAEREQRNRVLDVETAEQDLDAVLAKGHEGLAVARLELENAAAELRRIDRIIRNATVVAPMSGVVLSTGKGLDRSDQRLAVGTSIEPGQRLLTIGNVEGITATGRVGEVDVRRIVPGHAVRIAGPAFAGIVLEGEVQHVSSQAVLSTGGNLPTFEITAVVDTLNARQRSAVRLGMSASMEIVVYENNEALVVPVRAVDLTEDRPRVRVRDATAHSDRLVYVTTGVTTVDSVEIRSGITPGDRVAVP